MGDCESAYHSDVNTQTWTESLWELIVSGLGTYLINN